jgi:hypothetical protein
VLHSRRSRSIILGDALLLEEQEDSLIPKPHFIVQINVGLSFAMRESRDTSIYFANQFVRYSGSRIDVFKTEKREKSIQELDMPSPIPD